MFSRLQRVCVNILSGFQVAELWLFATELKQNKKKKKESKGKLTIIVVNLSGFPSIIDKTTMKIEQHEIRNAFSKGAPHWNIGAKFPVEKWSARVKEKK